MTPAPLQLGQAPSELALNSAGFTPLAFANVLRIGSSSPVYAGGLPGREPPIAPWSIDTTPAPAGIDPCTSELLPEPATPVTTTSTPSGMSTSTSRRLFAVAPPLHGGGGAGGGGGGGGAPPPPPPPPRPPDAARPPRRSGAGAEVDDVV